jgi:hypothetical protein
MKRFSQRNQEIRQNLKRELQIVYNSTGFYWNWSKLNAITSQALGFYPLHSPVLLLCSSTFLNWSLMVERDGYLPSSQHLLRSIGRLASHLLSRLFEWSKEVMCSVYMLLVLLYLCWIEVYIEINWFDRFWLHVSFALGALHHSLKLLPCVLYGSLNQVF